MLQFDEETHTYTVDGAEVPGVTRVLQDEGMLPSYQHLAPYHADRGRRIHDAVRWHLSNGAQPSDFEADIAPYVERFQRFAETVGLEPVMLEERLHCPVYGYAGTLDFAGRLNGERWVLDWKRATVEPGHTLQVAGGYLPMVQSQVDAGCRRAGIVTLMGDMPKLYPLEIDGQAEIFRSALATWKWKRAHMKGRR